MNRKEDEPVPLALEKHYSVAEIAELWAVSDDTVRRLFEEEPGVLTFGVEESARKRRYRSMRIPQSIMIRVHQRMRMN
jgi:transcriptional regulator GlxA family with amidase domain